MFKILKQEFLFIPIMFILMECLRWALFQYYPETALFDKGSELETFFFSLWQIVWISSSCLLLLRIIIPPAYYSFKEFYYTFNDRPTDQKHNSSIIFYLAFFFGLIWLVSGRAATNETMIRQKLIDTLHTQLYVREATGHNDGTDVEKYLTYVGRFKGDAWCAAFASWNLHAVGITAPPNPKSGWSPNFSTPQYMVWSHELLKQHKAKKIKPGDCFTLYYNDIKRVGHVGFIVEEKNNYFITIEGNTGLTGSREGSGVHKYKRSKTKIYRVTNYITPYVEHYETLTINTNPCDRIKLLSQAIDKNTRENNGANRYENTYKGFNLLQGQFIYNKAGQFCHTSLDHHRQGWNIEPPADHNRIFYDEALSCHKKRQALFKMQLQSPRAAFKNTEANYTAVILGKVEKRGGENYPRHKADTGYPLVG